MTPYAGAPRAVVTLWYGRVAQRVEGRWKGLRMDGGKRGGGKMAR